MIYIPDPVYNPNFVPDSKISAKTNLAPGVSIAKFIGAYGDRKHFNFITHINRFMSNLYGETDETVCIFFERI